MKKKIAFYLLIIGMMVGCYPQGPEYYEDLDLVYTNYDSDFDFGSKGTYYMPDKIVKITGDIGADEGPDFVKEPYNTQILNMIADNMTALGYTRTYDDQEADLLFFPASWTNTTVYYWYDYWCWYYPWYCGGWGWGYPSVSTYTTGTLVMALAATGSDYLEPEKVWTAAVNGLLSGNYNTSRIEQGIDQAFEQSPYLKTN
jgi:hypothetical protein